VKTGLNLDTHILALNAVLLQHRCYYDARPKQKAQLLLRQPTVQCTVRYTAFVYRVESWNGASSTHTLGVSWKSLPEFCCWKWKTLQYAVCWCALQMH